MDDNNKRKNTGKTRHRRTISKELHEQWRQLERIGDSTTLAKELEVSKPTIDKALIYGNVHKQAIVDGITKFFADRLLREKESSQMLKDLRNNNATTEVAA